MARFDLVYRVKDRLTDSYWNGKTFGTIGKIYVNPRLATKALKSKLVQDIVSDPLAPKRALDVVETSISDINIIKTTGE